MTESTSFVALENAIRIAGSQSALARVVGISQQSVSGWVKRKSSLPAEHVLAVEAATGISRHDLRPDLYPVDDIPPSPASLSGEAPPVVRCPVAGGAVSKHEAGA